MTPEPTPVSVTDIVHTAERLRMELLDALGWADKFQGVGVRIEMSMFFG